MKLWLGHNAGRIIPAAFLAVIVQSWLPAVWKSWMLSVILILTVAYVGYAAWPAHNRSLCERCAADLPLDPERYAWRFYVIHWISFNRMLMLAVPVFATGGILGNPIAHTVWSTGLLAAAYLMLAAVTHNKLQPWCMYCRQGGINKIVPEKVKA